MLLCGLKYFTCLSSASVTFYYHVSRMLALRWPVDLSMSGCFICCPMLGITGCAVVRRAGGIVESKTQQIRWCL